MEPTDDLKPTINGDEANQTKSLKIDEFSYDQSHERTVNYIFCAKDKHLRFDLMKNIQPLVDLADPQASTHASTVLVNHHSATLSAKDCCVIVCDPDSD